MAKTLTDIETRLLNLVQEQVPLTCTPFADLAAKLGVSEGEVLDLLSALKSPPNAIVRQISAIFDTKALGYSGSLVAARVPEEKLDRAVEFINSHPGVSHNYRRNHDYNLWYTIAVPPDSRLGLEKTIDILHERSGALQTRLMPTLKLYKIGVKLNLGSEDISSRSEAPRFTEEDRNAAMAFAVTDADKRMIRVLQQNLPIISRPFDAWAEQAQVPLDQFLASARRYETEKRMRRFSAVLHHREAGFKSNGMGVWVVPPEQQEAFGALAGSFSAVSHCYLRPTYPDWPYNLFTMVHAQSKADCDAVLESISQASGIKNYSALYSNREYKKTRVQYFTPDVELWETNNSY